MMNFISLVLLLVVVGANGSIGQETSDEYVQSSTSLNRPDVIASMQVFLRQTNGPSNRQLLERVGKRKLSGFASDPDIFGPVRLARKDDKPLNKSSERVSETKGKPGPGSVSHFFVGGESIAQRTPTSVVSAPILSGKGASESSASGKGSGKSGKANWPGKGSGKGASEGSGKGASWSGKGKGKSEKNNGKGLKRGKSGGKGKGKSRCDRFEFNLENGNDNDRRQLQFDGADCGNEFLDVAAQIPDLSIFLDLIDASGLSFMFSCAGPFTIAAPVNSAFEGIDFSNFRKSDLKDFVLHHVFPSITLKDDIEDGVWEALNGANVRTMKDPIKLNDASPIQTDILGCNFVTHTIDALLVDLGKESIRRRMPFSHYL
jgi:hypothetical protein